MIIEVQVPQLSESVADGTLASWKKNIGDSVARDEILIDIETDKVVLEVPSPNAGILVEIIKADGETVVSGELIARIDTEAKAGAVVPAPETPEALRLRPRVRRVQARARSSTKRELPPPQSPVRVVAGGLPRKMQWLPSPRPPRRRVQSPHLLLLP